MSAVVEDTTATATDGALEAPAAVAAAPAVDRGPGPDDHLLESMYTFWYMKRGNKSAAAQAESYEQSIKKIGDFASIEQFWALYSHIQRPGDPGTEKPMDYIMFKHGIKPMWEDENNKKGGKWVVRIPKKLSAYFWESLIMAIIGEQFEVGNEICGVVLSVRFSEDVLSIWNRTSNNREALERIRDMMRRVLKLPGNVQMDYRRHDTSSTEPFVDIDGGATNGSGWSQPVGDVAPDPRRGARGGPRSGGRGGGRFGGSRSSGGPGGGVRGSSNLSSRAPEGRWR